VLSISCAIVMAAAVLPGSISDGLSGSAGRYAPAVTSHNLNA
jgi:hypothetical protein